MARYWLLKTEPGCYSLDDLEKDRTTLWTGIRNYQARNFLKEVEPGDTCLFYHSSVEPPCAVGTCVITKAAVPDPTQFDPTDEHFDADSPQDDPRWMAPEVTFERTFAQPVTISAMRANAKLGKMKLLEKGSRLSVLPVTKEEFEEVVRMGAERKHAHFP